MAVEQVELEVAVRKAVLLHNRIKSPQAVAKAVAVSPDMVIIAFSGPFCYECGDVQKYVDDFAKDFKIFIDFVQLVAGKARETSPHNFEVAYAVKPR
jgi:hypothetical protein